MSGLLIVNADDFGASTRATDRTLRCFAGGALTSASAMVFMRDSARAARLAGDAGLPVGLHLNLTQPFDATDVPPAIARRQRAIVSFMRNERRRRVGIAPHLLPRLKRAIGDQLDCFRALFGAEPTHLDGHNHVHLNPTVLACLPRGYAVRPAQARANGGIARLPHRLRDAALRGRHPTVEHFFALSSVHPALGGSGLDDVLALAERDTVEVMVHPAPDRTFAVLVGAEWPARIASFHLGSYADIAASAPPREPAGSR